MTSPLSHLTQQYYQHHRYLKSRDKTIQWHQTSHRLFFKQCNIQCVDDITRESIRNFIYLNSVAGKSSETIKTYVRSIKAFYNWLLEEEYVSSNIFKKRILLPSSEEKPPKLISRSDLRRIAKILDAFPYYQNTHEYLRTKALFHLYMNTGVRKVEALETKVSNVNLKERTLLIEKSKTRDYRNVVINDDLYQVLEEYLLFLKEKNMKNDFLFFVKDPKIPMSDSAVRRIKKKIEDFGVRRFKIKRFTIHMFRHSYISYGIADGLPIPFLMNQAGHKKITTTQNYTHKPKAEMVHSLSNYSIIHSGL